jgi:hypothetical protein
MRVTQVSILVVHALLLVTLLWVVAAFCLYQFGGPANGVTDGLISPENGRWITIDLATELSFLAILSCVFISIFSSLNRRSFAILAALTTFSLSSFFVIVTTFWADPIAIIVPIAKSPTYHIFSEWNWLGFIFEVCFAIALATGAAYVIFRYSLSRQRSLNSR